MAAKAQGASIWRVIIKHILPNTMVMIVTLAPFGIVANITTLTALDYLGLGLMPPTPSWEIYSNRANPIWMLLDHQLCRLCHCLGVDHGDIHRRGRERSV